MKTLLTAIFVLSLLVAKAQTNDDNKIIKEIKGTIECDGHLMNDSVKFFIQVDLDGFKIKGSNGKVYQKRACNSKNCKLIHLEPVTRGMLTTFWSPIRWSN